MTSENSLRLDNTQYTAFTKCPAYWYEKYIRKQRLPPEIPYKNALAIGIHVHSALENGYRYNKFAVSPDTLEEYPLTPEATMEVRAMTETYRQNFPAGPVEFPWVGLEAPIQYIDNDIILVAKVDGYYKITEPTVCNDGLGNEIHLEPGIYSFETKTKAPYLDRGLYMKEWQAAMQPSFQLLTLRNYLDRIGESLPIRGVLVNVIERPKIYTPRKTCKGCKTLLPLYTYTIQPDGKYKCNNCNHINDAPSGPTPEPRVDPPVTWRFLIERSDERLANDFIHISKVYKMMTDTLEHNLVFHRTECVNTYQKRTCEYFEPHNATNPQWASNLYGFELFNPTKYLEIKEDTIE